MQVFSNPNVEVRGSAADLVKRKLMINGVEVDQVGLGFLAKYGILDVVGEADKPARGRAAKLLAGKTSAEIKFSFGG
jgi:hypothetical protein